MTLPLSRLLHRPVAVGMVSSAVVLAGLFAFTRLPIELAPSIDFPSLTARCISEFAGHQNTKAGREVQRAVGEKWSIDLCWMGRRIR